MKGDFTRSTFRPEAHYRAVYMQQGRVQLDADWNEQVDIRDHLDRLRTADTLGKHGGPNPGALELEVEDKALYLTAGHYYVDGILCENDARVALDAQPELREELASKEAGTYSAYLDVWSEHVTAVDTPELREAALGGPDTTTRVRTVWQVRLKEGDEPPTPPLPKRGKLAASATKAAPPADPADPAAPTAPAVPTASAAPAAPKELRAPAKVAVPAVDKTSTPSTRRENQLYRVEIHDGDGPTTEKPTAEKPTTEKPTTEKRTFVWSRENGSVAARLTNYEDKILTHEDKILTQKHKILTIDAPGRDERLGFTAGDWVEIVEPDGARSGKPGWLAQLATVDGSKLTVDKWRSPLGVESAPPSREALGLPKYASTPPHPVVRRWDSRGAQPVEIDKWVELEAGVWIWFTKGALRTGDYWLIPARSASAAKPEGDVQWPSTEGRPVALAPFGIEHHYAPLAQLKRNADKSWSLDGDRRKLYSPLATLGGTVTGLQDTVTRLESAQALAVVGGNGQIASSDGTLPQPVRVLVHRGAGPVPKATVRFAVGSGSVAPVGSGPAAAARSVEVATGIDGVATCSWQLGPSDPVQELIASLATPGVPAGVTVTVTAARSLERAVLLVTQTTLSPLPTAKDRDVSVADLTTGVGVGVVLDRLADRASIDEKPVLRVVLDMPWPFTAADQDLWGTQEVLGTTPLALDGTVRFAVPDASAPGRTSITWRPTEATGTFLTTLFARLTANDRGDSIAGRLVLDGRAITAADDADVHAEDYVLHFRLVHSVDDVVVVPLRNAPLGRRPKLREMLEAIVPAQQMPTDLKPGLKVAGAEGAASAAAADEAAEVAEVAAKAGFPRGRGARRLVVAVETATVPAAQSLKNALAGIGVELHIVPTGDLASTIASPPAGEPIDGIVTTYGEAKSLAARLSRVDSLDKTVKL